MTTHVFKMPGALILLHWPERSVKNIKPRNKGAFYSSLRSSLSSSSSMLYAMP
jgi:hypothetical protein